MNERMKELRKLLGVTQQEFADRLGVKRVNIATYETGKSMPGDAVVSLICREFNVSEAWLRTGDGDPFIKKSRNAEIYEYVDRIQGVNDAFKSRFASALATLEEEDWNIILSIINDIKNRSMTEKVQAQKAPSSAPSAVSDLSPEEKEIIRQHRERLNRADA